MKKKDVVNIVVLIMIITVGFIRMKRKRFTFKDSSILMDTLVEISITTNDKNGQVLIDSAYTLITQYENKLSYYIKNSVLDHINSSQEVENEIDEEIYYLLNLANDIYMKSDSLYDVSIGQLTDIWDFENQIIPSEKEIDEAKKFCGFDKVKFSENKVIRPIGFKLNFGSFAKGFIVDKIVEFLESKNVDYGYVNAGGDIRLFGAREDYLTIGVQHPRNRTTTIEILKLQKNAVVTSGDYERFFEKEGKRYHHILNPKTGYPAENIISVTVIAPTAVLADALSTACFLLDPNESVNLIKQYDNTEVIIYYKDNNNEIYSLKTQGIKDFK